MARHKRSAANVPGENLKERSCPACGQPVPARPDPQPKNCRYEANSLCWVCRRLKISNVQEQEIERKQLGELSDV